MTDKIKRLLLVILLFSISFAVSFTSSYSSKLYEIYGGTTRYYSDVDYSVSIDAIVSSDATVIKGDPTNIQSGDVVCAGNLNIKFSPSGTFSTSGLVPIPTSLDPSEVPDCGSCPSSGNIIFNRDYSSLSTSELTNAKYSVEQIVGKTYNNKQLKVAGLADIKYYVNNQEVSDEATISIDSSTNKITLSSSVDPKMYVRGGNSDNYLNLLYCKTSIDANNCNANFNVGPKTIELTVVDQDSYEEPVVVVTPSPIVFSNNQADVSVEVSLNSELPARITVSVVNATIISQEGNGEIYEPTNGRIDATISLTLQADPVPSSIGFTVDVEGDTCAGKSKSTSTITVPSKPDKEKKPNLVSNITGTNTLKVGQSTTLTITTKNIGDKDASSSVTALYLEGSNNPLTSSNIDELAINKSQSFTYTFTCEQEGDFTFNSIADVNNDVDESNEQDNSYSFVVHCAQKDIPSCKIDIDGDPTNLEKNKNYTLSLTCYLNDQAVDCKDITNDTIEWSVGSPFSIEGNNHTATLTTPSSPASSTANAKTSEFSCSLDVAVKGNGANLVSSLSGQTTLNVGESTSIAIETSNNGDSATENSSITALYVNDQKVEDYTIGSLNPSDSSVNTYTITCEKEGDVYNIRAVADEENNVYESNENDNTATLTVTCNSAPVSCEISKDPDLQYVGQTSTFTVRCKVHNQYVDCDSVGYDSFDWQKQGPVSLNNEDDFSTDVEAVGSGNYVVTAKSSDLECSTSGNIEEPPCEQFI